MSIYTESQKFLENCRVIKPSEVKDGIIVTLDPTEGFEVINFSTKTGSSDVVGTFGLFDIFDENTSQMVLNFKKTMSDIVGRKKYYIETNVYSFLADEDLEIEDDIDIETVEERAAREAEEEEEAEQEFERFLKAQEEM